MHIYILYTTLNSRNRFYLQHLLFSFILSFFKVILYTISHILLYYILIIITNYLIYDREMHVSLHSKFDIIVLPSPFLMPRILNPKVTQCSTIYVCMYVPQKGSEYLKERKNFVPIIVIRIMI